MNAAALAPLFLLLLEVAAPQTQEAQYAELRREAEKLHAEGSYALARELYVKADALELPALEALWVDFRLADTGWRSQAATQQTDNTKIEEARSQLEALNRALAERERQGEPRGRLWAEIQESLGDFWWTRRDARNWGGAWPLYEQALGWWAGDPDIELARKRYLRIVWTGASPPWREPYYYYGYHGNMAPLAVLENALKIAPDDDSRAHAHYLIAMTLRQQGGDAFQRARIPREFEAAIAAGKKTDWYDDALFHYGQHLESGGKVTYTDGGGYREEPDYVRAVAIYRRFLQEHEKGETRYYDQAKAQIEGITRPVVGVTVSNIFLPGSEVQYHLNWRNVARVELALYAIDLTRDVSLAHENASSGNWLQFVNLGGLEKIREWSKETGDRGDHAPGQEALRLDFSGEKPATGAYVIEARGGGVGGRDLLLVTDAALVLKNAGGKTVAFFADAASGAPLAGATVRLWQRYHDGKRTRARELGAQTDEDGLSLFQLEGSASNRDLFAAARLGDRQAFATGSSYYNPRQEGAWRIYAFTDRPAYRPEDTVQWKLVARRHDGGLYSTPAGTALELEVLDPRGAKVKEEKVELNDFGSAWGSLALDASMPLGEYHVRFLDAGRKNHIGQAVLFRLEEYKLPEFQVKVELPEEGGRKKTFRLGERVEAVVAAEYYFGGPVADAAVEVLVYQRPFYPYWEPVRDYPWYYGDTGGGGDWRWGGGPGQVVQRETLKTDRAGRAMVTINTQAGGGQELDYRIEARVTDASRREITGSGSVRVTRQSYYVHLRPRHYLYRPGDKVTVDVKALDANDEPVATEGAVKVTRERWVEIWIDADGKEVPRERAARAKFRGYVREDVLATTVKTSAEGAAELTFTPDRDGYYRLAWRSEDRPGVPAPPVTAETTVWVATNATTEIGYRHGGVEIIADRDTFKAGDEAPVMLVAPAANRFVLFTVEGEDLYHHRLVHLEGTVKLLHVPIDDRHVPNVFLGAAMVSDGQLFADQKEIVVPPVEHFLSLEVAADRADYEPREEGTFTVTARNHEGKPVAAEVALGLVDESVYYVQQEYAGDPRQFYYGEKRGLHVQMGSTFQQKGYVKLKKGEGEELVSERAVDPGFDQERQLAEMEGYDEAWGAMNGGGGLRRERLAGLRDAAKKMPGRARGQALGMLARNAAASTELLAAAPASEASLDASGSAGAGAGAEPAVVVRADFRATALWEPGVVTGPDGTATVKVKLPDSLTRWKATARAASKGSEYGIAASKIRTRQPLIVRLQAPRFFLAGDRVTVSAVINNNTGEALQVRPALEAAGLNVLGALVAGKLEGREHGAIEVPAGGEARADWLVAPEAPGEARLKATARGGRFADAMEKSFIVHEHGIERFLARSGKVRGDEVTVKLDLPRERKPGSTDVGVQVTPSLAVTLLDALPYLIDYPYGCTEQTLSRFLPTVITMKTLRELDLAPEDIAGRLFGGIEPAGASKTHPGGKRALEQVDAMVKAGLERLYDFQHGDGGWGWWKEGESDHFMSAYVVWGLSLARAAGVEVKMDVLERGAGFLDKEIVEAEGDADLQAWMLHALAAWHAAAGRGEMTRFQTAAFANLWKNRDSLNAYTRALFTLAAHAFGRADEAAALARNLANGVKRDDAPDTSIVVRGSQEPGGAAMATAHWGEDRVSWRWSEGAVEATSFALRALIAVDPQNKLIEPVMNWLVKNRRGSQWRNTRDTAIAVLALNDYLGKSGELEGGIDYEITVNGRPLARRAVSAAEVLAAPSRFPVGRELVADGPNEIKILRRGGKGPIYFAVQASFFSLEEPIPPAGSEIFVRRQYYKLVGRPTLLKGHVYDREPLSDGGSVASGERVEVVLHVEAKNDAEYLVFEDLKPAGLEAVELRSGQSLHAREVKSGAAARRLKEAARSATGAADADDFTGRDRWVYQELRDRKVALFIDKLPEGIWELRYDLRAEVPGQFHALPVLGHAMYVPEIRTNGEEVRIRVDDRP